MVVEDLKTKVENRRGEISKAIQKDLRNERKKNIYFLQKRSKANLHDGRAHVDRTADRCDDLRWPHGGEGSLLVQIRHKVKRRRTGVSHEGSAIGTHNTIKLLNDASNLTRACLIAVQFD